MGGRIGARMEGLRRSDEEVDHMGFESANPVRGSAQNEADPRSGDEGAQ